MTKVEEKGRSGGWQCARMKKKASIDKVCLGTLSPLQDNFSECCNYVADISCAIL